MKAFVAPTPGLSRAMTRVARALAQHAPVIITEDESEADIVVLHVIGYPETVRAIDSIKARGKKYAIIQYCVRSTQERNTLNWLPLWSDPSCLCVWSYYDLPALVAEDGASWNQEVKFYHAPMGVDSKTFQPRNVPKRYILFTSGYVAESETVLECQEAVRNVGGRMFHLGPGLPGFDASIVTQEQDISDGYLVELMSSCHYVAGLRREEGFEMPALEGLLCGVRPICYDRPHYRRWFGNHAEYIPEGSPEQAVKDLTAILEGNYRPVSTEERRAIERAFDWSVIAGGFWKHALPQVAARPYGRKTRLLWIGDAVVSSGFARATHKILEGLRQDYEIGVLGINYFGDPHDYPYPIYPSLNPLAQEADLFGVKRIVEVAQLFRPDVIVLQQDPWNVPAYMKELQLAHLSIPVVGFIAVDGKNCKGTDLNDLALAIFWTEFGMAEARAGGYTGPAAVVPLGVDTKVYYPLRRQEARTIMELPKSLHNAFIVGNVNRNQPRKRLDLTVRYFCNWVRQHDVRDAFLFLHVAPTGDVGWDVRQLMQYYGCKGRLILASPHVGRGVPEDILRATYSCFDVQVNTAAGEGWGLTTLEGMACAVPQIVPDWAALGEWARGAASLIPCTSFTHTPGSINVLGGVPDEKLFIEELQRYYSTSGYWERNTQACLDRANQPQFRWENIAARFSQVLAEGLSLVSQREAVSA
jgi:D-inositol-3-phosphate glycosyltransferase